MPSSRPPSTRRALFAAAALVLVIITDPSHAPSARAQQGQAASPAASSASYLLVLNKAEASVTIIDPVKMEAVGRVAVGEGPHEVVTSADGRTAYVSNYGGQKPGNSISIIDLAARKETKRVDLGALWRPHGLVEREGKIYFTAEVNRAVARYDPASDKVDWVMGLGEKGTHMLVFHPTRKTIYTANIGSDTASVIELDKPSQPGPPPRVTHVPVGKQPEAIDISPDGREVWVGHNADGGVSIIDTETQKVKETIKVGGMPIRVKFTPDGKRVLVSSPPTGELTILDAATRKELKRIKLGTPPPQGEPAPTGQIPIGVLVAPDSRSAFVALTVVVGGQPAAGKVARINLESMEVAGSVETGQGPDGLGWAGK
ncbi:MAG TPA: cytochrome D1 domain-containing protein [Pyrinomonadaceae bacterium]